MTLSVCRSVPGPLGAYEACKAVQIHLKRPADDVRAVVRGFAIVNEMQSRELQLHVESRFRNFLPLWLKVTGRELIINRVCSVRKKENLLRIHIIHVFENQTCTNYKGASHVPVDVSEMESSRGEKWLTYAGKMSFGSVCTDFIWVWMKGFNG